MKYGKQLKSILNQEKGNNGLVAVALVSGLAVGAALALLFAPKKGQALRGDIAAAPGKFGGSLSELMDAIKSKFGSLQQIETETNHHQNGQATPHAAAKKPKSDIGEILHQVHISGQTDVQQN